MKFFTSRMGGHVAGTGIEGYFDYSDKGVSGYRPIITSAGGKVPGITLPNEDPKRWAELSGPCETVVEGREK